MTLRFVKTSILTSSDGIDFSDEQQLESEDVRNRRLAQESAAVKPLFQQLAELKEQQKVEYDENTKLIFAPPKALDDEDIEYLREMDDSHARSKALIKQQEQQAILAFREARNSEISQLPLPLFSNKKKEAKITAKPATVFRVKRKHAASGVESSAGHTTGSSSSSSNSNSSAHIDVGSEVAAATVKKRVKVTAVDEQDTVGTTTADRVLAVAVQDKQQHKKLSMLAAYDSDSD